MKIVSVFLLALSALSLSACNTIEGMGKDIKAGALPLNAPQTKTRSNVYWYF